MILARANGVLETRERGLRRKLGPRHGAAVEQQFEDRISGQARGVIGVRITASQPLDALAQEVFDTVSDFAALPLINQASRQRRC